MNRNPNSQFHLSLIIFFRVNKLRYSGCGNSWDFALSAPRLWRRAYPRARRERLAVRPEHDFLYWSSTISPVSARSPSPLTPTLPAPSNLAPRARFRAARFAPRFRGMKSFRAFLRPAVTRDGEIVTRVSAPGVINLARGKQPTIASRISERVRVDTLSCRTGISATLSQQLLKQNDKLVNSTILIVLSKK